MTVAPLPKVFRIETQSVTYVVMSGFCTDIIDTQTFAHRRTHPALGGKFTGEKLPRPGERAQFRTATGPFYTGTITRVSER